MNILTLKRYLLNCLWLILPVMLFDALLTTRLPAAYQMDFFWKDTPTFIAAGENFFRSIIFILPILMPLDATTRSQKIGVWVYLAGILVYFLAWGALILWPQSGWSTSWIGFLAPAYTALPWLIGIGLIGERFYFISPYRSWMYLGLSAVFIFFHLAHTWTVFMRL
jgi:hypothetical protein